MPPLIQISKPKLNLAAVRRKLESAKGPAYWSSLEEVAQTEEFRQYAEDEFAHREMDWADESKRRTFLKVMGASLALAGVGACTKQPAEAIVPYVRQPEEIVPGKPLFYATAMPWGGGAAGVLVESHMGRPTKVEGNPTHPGSLGGTDAFTQASILDLYDPDRSQTVLHNAEISSWVNFAAALNRIRDLHLPKQGAGLRLLTTPIASPTLGAQLQEFQKAFPAAKWHQWDPVRGPRAHNTIYHFENANVIVSLDADFLGCGSGNPRYAHDFAKKRRLDNGSSEMSRLYVAEGTVTNTGGMADHRLRMRASEVTGFAAELARAVGGQPASGMIAAIARDLLANRGSSLVLAGDYQPASVHAIAHSINETLGNIGKTVDYTAPLELAGAASLKQLVDDMNASQVETLLILGCNPVYDAPADFGFLEAMKKVKLRAHLGAYADETAAYCQWHIPEAHYLEAWSDTRAYDGTITIMQPLILPLYGGKTAHEILNFLVKQSESTPYDILRDHWEGQAGTDFNAFWQRSLNDGVVAGTTLAVGYAPKFEETSTQPGQGLEIQFRPDPAIWDGRFSNNSWLQEMPKPQNKMTWDNAVWISPRTAQRLGISNEDQLEIELRGRRVMGPAWVMPGHADESLTLQLGFGRTSAGNNANAVGFNAYTLRTSESMWCASGAQVRKTGKSHAFATTQFTQTMESREPVKLMLHEEYLKNPKVEAETVPRELTMYPEFKYDGYKWGMAIDLNACTGCQACVVACQAENNVPVVGKDQVGRGRHMHWLRVDRYYKGKLDDPELYFQPIPCMQCETAPCELVCPVGATVHSGDGLNQMVYNRCVGTRYCSNNCPYKVRRFNFYRYSDWYTESLYGLRNPDVTVRSRGVMEKCTYCIQRIAQAKIESEKDDRRIRDGEVIPACAQACPSQAIVFGDLNDPNSQVARYKAQPRNYGLLEELNTRPRTTFLARVRNPNPEAKPS